MNCEKLVKNETADIIFVTPNFGGYVREEPVGTLLLTTILRQVGMSVDILPFHLFGDVRNFADFLECAYEKISAKCPQIVSFYTRCDSYHITLKIAQIVKERMQSVHIVFAGPQADLSARDTLVSFPFVDYVCRGEGETTVVPFFSSLLSGVPNHAIKGLAYRSGDEIILNPKPEFVDDLDTLPTIDYSSFNYRSEGRTSTARILFPVDVGRGCPFSCTFCSTKNFWGRRYRLKSAERIIEEIIDIHNRFGVTDFNFEHDMFTMNRQKVLYICKRLKELSFPIKWRCSARIDCLDNELVDAMVDAGMDIVFMGIETGSARMQKLIKKNLKLENVVEKIAYISSKGAHVTTSFIFGFPDETEDDFVQTMDLMIKLAKIPRVNVQCGLCAFFPGTELTEEYKDQIQKATVYSVATGEAAVEECKDLIDNYPNIFPQYYEVKTPYRERIKYYSQFFKCWLAMRPVYEYLMENYYTGRLCDMLYEFTDRNRKMLLEGKDWVEILKNDSFVDEFSSDPQYSIIKEVYRFYLWKMNAEKGDTEVFGFDVKELLNGIGISGLKPALVVASCIRTDHRVERGKIELKLQKK